MDHALGGITALRNVSLGLAWAAILGFAGLAHPTLAQTILTPWGNLAGVRVEGDPVDFEAGLRLVHPGWTGFSSAVKYLQTPHYSRTGAVASVRSAIEGVDFHITVQDLAPGEIQLDLKVKSNTNLALAGTYFCLELPDAEFGGGTLEFFDPAGSEKFRLLLATNAVESHHARESASGMRITAARTTLEVQWHTPLKVIVRRDASDRPTALNDPSVRQRFLTSPNVVAGQPASYQVYIELLSGPATPGLTAAGAFKLTAKSAPDASPVRLVLDAGKPGRAFDGIGGNFRLQFPKTDPAVLQYNLDHLPVAWGRVDMPWAEWDPDENREPLAAARAGQLHPRVREAMETARTLARRRIPVILSAWSPPQWARAVSQPPGLRGTALNVAKLGRICSSLADCLIFLKEHRGVEAVYFSFNEPETGVEVRQTAAEHAQFIKLMGPELAARGLTTKLLLGDTAHGTPAALEFTRPSRSDPGTHRWIGALAFHTWRGCTPEALSDWAEAARQLGVPLLITESGPDAHLHEYPSVRLEPWFQLQEIELYLRCCAYGQPATIMEWQFTTDYSVLGGAGIYGEPGPLRPTQRFWNLKQLGLTAPGAFALPLRSDREEVTCAAFGDLANGTYALHIVNRGAGRRALLEGLPPALASLRAFITDAGRGMEASAEIIVAAGRAEFVLPPASYVTLLGTVPDDFGAGAAPPR